MQLTGLPPSQGGLSSAQIHELVAAGWELDTQGFSHADLITLDAPNVWSLQQCCSVAGLGGSPSNGHYRDGSFAYYVSEPIVKNDLKGVGPFILAGIELQGWANH